MSIFTSCIAAPTQSGKININFIQRL